MPAAKPAARRKKEPARRAAKPANQHRPGRPADYEDEITREQIESLNRIVPDDAFDEFKTVSGPGW
jgi:hypothetical protein